MDVDVWPAAFAQMQSATTLRHASGRQNRPNYELHGPCPVCGGEDRFVVQPNQKRWLCRNCRTFPNGKIRWGDGLDYLALAAGMSRDDAWRAFVAEDRPPPTPSRRRTPHKTAQDAPGWRFRPIPITKYREWQQRHISGILDDWGRYKPVSAEMVAEYGLAVGRVPYSRCNCDRLLIPITDGQAVFCIRGRIRPGETCPHTAAKKKATWLANAGFSLHYLPLFNAHRCAPGCIAVLVENPVDAMILSEGPALAYEWLRQGVPRDILAAPLGYAAALASRGIRPIVGVATLSAYYWRDAWESALAQCSLVVVALDDDLVGNGGGAHRPALVQEWVDNHLDHPVPPPAPCGPARQQALKAAGIPVALYTWPGDCKDFGEWHTLQYNPGNP